MSKPSNTRIPTSHIPPFGLRMQADLKERLESAAASANRSLNAEIVARLERSFEGDGDSKLIDELLQKMLARLAEKGSPPFNHDFDRGEK